ncbi:MAG: glycosyltransferase family 1 protein, partial [Ferruginibacter sp.]
SENTRNDLQRFLSTRPVISEVVYNGLNQQFKPGDPAEARILLTRQCGIELNGGYILHVGGNQWYKNRRGIVEIYDALRSKNNTSLPLLLIGKNPDAELASMIASSDFKTDIYCLSNINDEAIKLAYKGATVFLFPSLAEGFGWPIAEAMASGCPVITTDEAPMTEVSGDAGFLIARRPFDDEKIKTWAEESAEIVNQVINLSPQERARVIESGIINARRFNTQESLEKIEAIYTGIFQSYKK